LSGDLLNTKDLAKNRMKKWYCTFRDWWTYQKWQYERNCGV